MLLPLSLVFRVKDRLAAEITDVTVDAGAVLVVSAFAHHVERT